MNKKDYLFRFNKVKKLILNEKADSLIFISSINRFWFSGVETTFGYVLITKTKSFVFIDHRDYDYCKKNINFANVVLFESNETLKQYIKKLNINKTLFEKDYVSYSQYEQLNKLFPKLIPISTMNLRIQKTFDEIKNIKIAAKIACDAINWIRKTIKVGMTEKQVKTMITKYMLDKGASKTSFDLIVAFGQNTAIPHHQSSDRKLKAGEFITLDIGCIYNGYCSDITRTFWLGKPSKQMLEFYNLVLEANKYSIKQLKVNSIGKLSDQKCRQFLKDKNPTLSNFFVHGLGHGVGIEIHEEPYLNKIYQGKILENSIVTIEPGIYKSGFGGVRIEDLILVQKNKIEVLTKSCPK